MRQAMTVLLTLVLMLVILISPDIGIANQQGQADHESTVVNAGEGSVKSYANKWAVIPKTNKEVVVDGAFDEWTWRQHDAVLKDFVTAYHHETVGNGPEYHIAYDDQNLYIAGKFMRAEAEDLARIEFVITRSSSESTYYIVSIPVNESSRIISTNWSPDWRPGSTWHGVNITASAQALVEDEALGVWRLEVAIPLSSFNLSDPIGVGEEWGMNLIHIFDLNTRQLMSWIPVGTTELSDGSVEPGGNVRLSANVVDQSRLGSLFFGGLPGDIIPYIQNPSGRTWADSDWGLEYISFTKKRLVLTPSHQGPLQFQLQWKTPTGDWETLSDFDWSEDGSQVVLEFSHPEPLSDGLYQLSVLAMINNAANSIFSIFTFDRKDLIEAGLNLAGRQFPAQRTLIPVQPQPASVAVMDIMNRIPDQFGVPHVGLPEMPHLRPNISLYRLSDDGEYLIANETGTVYPNETYAETKVLSAINRKGEKVDYPYYEDAEGRKYFISANLWNQQLRVARADAAEITPSDPLGGARLLYRFAQKSEGFILRHHMEWNTYPVHAHSGPPYSSRTAYWSIWKGEELQHLDLFLNMYEEISKTDAFEVLSAEVGEDVREKILQELFLAPIDVILTRPMDMHNVDPYVWQRMVRMGKMFGIPDFIHIVVEWIENFLSSQFLSDGFWKEVTPAYHQQTVGNIIVAINALKGYSDPSGYISPRTGQRFDHLDMEQKYPGLSLMRTIANEMTYPNGKQVPIQDTWAHTNRVSLPNAGPLLMPAAGIGRLTVGNGNTQSQLYTMFTPKYGHNHWDPLNLVLFAEGQELIPDIGYTYTKYRQFASSTIGHNTVVVDSRNMDYNANSRDGGNIEQFVTVDGAFQVMRAAYPGAYSETSVYSREPWFVPFADGTGEKGYVLDLFRVSGGGRHEYTLHGDANLDAFFRTELSLTNFGPNLLPPGTVVQEPTNYQDFGSAEGHYPGYMYVRDVKQADLDGLDQYQLTLVTMDDNSGEQAKLSITGLLEEGENELYLGRSPSMRSTRLKGNNIQYDNDVEADKYDMPKFVLRRDGTDLDSTFITVMEPYRNINQPRIEVIERLLPDQAPTGAVAVKVTYGNTTDILLSNPEHPDQPLIVGDITLDGEMGLIRLVDGKVRDMYMVGGTLLAKGSRQINGFGAVSGTIIDTLRTTDGDPFNALITDAILPGAVSGRYVVVTHPDGSTSGYMIDQVMNETDRTTIVLAGHDPGFRISADGSSRQMFYPAKSWNGVHTLRVADVIKVEGLEPIGIGETGTLTGVVYDPDGFPISGAIVQITGYATTVQSDAGGNFTLSSVPVGWQRVTVVHPDYGRVISELVYVEMGQLVSLVVSLPDTMPPVLSDVTLAVAFGEPVTAMSSRNGYLYLVPEGTPPVAEVIENTASTAGGIRVPVLSGISTVLDTATVGTGRYLVYAIDENHRVSIPQLVHIVPTELTIIDDTNSLIMYSGSWIQLENPGYIEGTSRYSNTKGDYIEIPFYGKQAIVLGHRNNSGGLVDVYVDGVYQGEADYRHSQQILQEEIYNTGLLENGAHVIRLVVRGERSAGTSIYAQVRFDALRVLMEDELPPVLTNVTSGPLIVGDPVQATSNKDGMLYLVPSTTPSTRSAIEEAGNSLWGRSMTVTEAVYGSILTAGLSTDSYNIYAIDELGNVSISSDPIFILDPADTHIDSTSGVVIYVGNWRVLENPGYHLGSSLYANDQGDYVEISFYGKRAIVLGHRNNAGGLANVYVDGESKGIVDYFSSSLQLQDVIFDTGTLPESFHTIRIVARGERSGGTSAYTQIRFDALQLFVDEE